MRVHADSITAEDADVIYGSLENALYHRDGDEKTDVVDEKSASN